MTSRPKLASQAGDVDFDRVARDVAFEAIDQLFEHWPRDDASWAAHEHFEKRISARRQVDRRVLDRDAACCRVK